MIDKLAGPLSSSAASDAWAVARRASCSAPAFRFWSWTRTRTAWSGPSATACWPCWPMPPTTRRLKHAGILRAKGLIATLQSDADNLFVILSAKALEAVAAGFRARRFRAKRKENAAGRRRLRVRALRHDRQSHGASDAEAARVSSSSISPPRAWGWTSASNSSACRPSSEFASKIAARNATSARELGVIVLAIRKAGRAHAVQSSGRGGD